MLVTLLSCISIATLKVKVEQPILYLSHGSGPRKAAGFTFSLCNRKLSVRDVRATQIIGDSGRPARSEYAVDIASRTIIQFWNSHFRMVAYDFNGGVRWKRPVGGGDPHAFLLAGNAVLFIPNAPLNTYNPYRLSPEGYLRWNPNDVQVVARSLATGKQLWMKPLIKWGLPLMYLGNSEYLALTPNYSRSNSKPSYSLQIRSTVDCRFISDVTVKPKQLKSLVSSIGPYGKPWFTIVSSKIDGPGSVHKLNPPSFITLPPRKKRGNKCFSLQVDRRRCTANIRVFFAHNDPEAMRS